MEKIFVVTGIAGQHLCKALVFSIKNWSFLKFPFIFKEVQTKKKIFRQSRENICRRFHILTQFPFTKSDIELDYYHQKMIIQVVLGVAKWVKTYEILGNWGILRKSLRCFKLMENYSAGHPKDKFWQLCYKILKKSAAKH